MNSWVNKVKAGVRLPRPLVENTAGFYLDTLVGYLFPLITLPYLVRVLGAQSFGLVAFAQSFITYLMMATDFALLLSGTRKLVPLRQHPLQVSQVVVNALTLRFLIALGLFFPTLFACHWFSALKEARSIVFVLYLVVFASALNLTWVFAAFERMWLLARCNTLINLAVILGIFLLVHAPEDTKTYAWLLAAGPVAGSAVSLILGSRAFSLSWPKPRLREMWAFAREGFPLALAFVAVSLYTTGNAFLLGTLAAKEEVGYFAAADKVVRAGIRLLGPMTIALFPRMVQASLGSPHAFREKIKKLLAFYFGLGVLLALGTWLTAPWVVRWFFGPAFSPAISLLRILGLLFLFSSLTSVLGMHFLLPAGKDRAFLALSAGAGIANLGMAWWLVPRLQAAGMALAAVASEALVAACEVLLAWSLLRQMQAAPATSPAPAGFTKPGN